MEIITDGQIYQEVKDIFGEHGGIDYDNRCSVQRVRVGDEKEWLSKLFKLIKVKTGDLSLLFYVQEHFNELSQSNPSAQGGSLPSSEGVGVVLSPDKSSCQVRENRNTCIKGAMPPLSGRGTSKSDDFEFQGRNPETPIIHMMDENYWKTGNEYFTLCGLKYSNNIEWKTAISFDIVSCPDCLKHKPNGSD